MSEKIAQRNGGTGGTIFPRDKSFAQAPGFCCGSSAHRQRRKGCRSRLQGKTYEPSLHRSRGSGAPTFLNVKAALEAAGASMKDIVRLDTYVVSSALNEWRTVGRNVKSEMLGNVHPPGATVFVVGLMIPEALVEVSAIAAID